MLWIKVKGAGTADDQQARIRAREDIGEVLRCRGIKRQRLFLPSTESINDGVKAGEIFLREVEDVLLAVVLCLRVVLRMASKGDDLMATAQRLGDDFSSDMAICCYNCDFHSDFSFSYTGQRPQSLPCL